MIRSPRFLLGVAAGAVATWWVARRRGARVIAATPYQPRPLTRRPRLGANWPGSIRERGSQR